MKNIHPGFIPCKEFIKKYPLQVQDLAELYHIPHEITMSKREFDYYRTKKLMPHTNTFKRKAYYKDSSEMYKKLFIAWYLMQSKRTYEDRLKIMNAIESSNDVDTLSVLLDNEYFLKNVISHERVRKAIDNLLDKPSIEREDLFEIVKYLLKKEMEDFEKILLGGKKNSVTTEQCEEISRRFDSYQDIKKRLSSKISKMQSIVKKTNLSKNKMRILRPILHPKA